MDEPMTAYRLPNGVVVEWPASWSIGQAVSRLKYLSYFTWLDCVRATPNPDGSVDLCVITEAERREW